jgi:hypothetical protein
MNRAQWGQSIRQLFTLSETRGKEAAGLAIATSGSLFVTKDSVAASDMMKTREFGKLLERADGWFEGADSNALAAIGHSRLVTNGLQGIDSNNQPVWRDEIVLIHNGIVVNVDELWEREKSNGIEPRADVDTEVIAALISRYRREGRTVEAAVSQVFEDIYGETSIAFFLRDTNAMYFATNTGSLYMCVNAAGTGMFFASERYICAQLTEGSGAIPGFERAEITQLRPGQGATVNLETLNMHVFELAGGKSALAAPSIAPMLAVQREVEEKSSRAQQALKLMPRCSKCLLPQTMPFIAYDADGVCNYCHSYKPWVKRPEGELRERLERVRSKNGLPDCIVAFSGGRDSSYGLHVLKTEYDMTPLTFSYDWGMVTDLARRNQARMCGKLGIEHIWVSADIKQKRAHIRRNVLAWLKKPDLGLIPLFMAGDKEVFWHANRLMETYKINEMVFCTNELEKTIFKQGFLGIDARESTVHKPSSLPLIGKLGMLWKYGSRFVQNPAYFNRSMPDTLFAFFSYYVIKQNLFSLFDFMPWDEDEINSTLIDGYEWETAPDSLSTWRIGDGTAPFYNYVYFTVAGFTEYDTFRSNQIREGALTREAAMKFVNSENQPRWKSIRDYAQMINVDFDHMIRTVDRIPKLYLT